MTCLAGALAPLTGCGAPASTFEPIFLQGRAVEPDGDSLVAVTARAIGAIVRYDRRGRVRDTLGLGALRNPDHVQLMGDTWYVSDVENGRPIVVLLGRDGALRRTLPLAGIAATTHQFAVLPDGGIVVEGEDGRLLTLRGDSITTFAVVEVGQRPSLLLGAGGGVLHAIPDLSITLYNGFGNIRWRVEWPWVVTAFVSDVSEDSRGRVHVLVGNPGDNTFTAQTLTPATGEVIRWSVPTDVGSFVVDRLGEVLPAGARWGGK
ncbi:MAG: hypothetical protein OER21_00560 [Gemmatimonadota bacterium]|nr:hypothetical protein [Gemmatimonadota bacterium]